MSLIQFFFGRILRYLGMVLFISCLVIPLIGNNNSKKRINQNKKTSMADQEPYTTYQIRPGDNYSQIGKKFKINYLELIKLNRNRKLYAGTTIKIPHYFHYRIQSGDNLYNISKKFKVKLKELKKYNPGYQRLLIGQKIKIPSETPLTLAGQKSESSKKITSKKKTKNQTDTVFKNNKSTTKKKTDSNNTLKKTVESPKSEELNNLLNDLTFVWPVSGTIEQPYGIHDDILTQGILLKLKSDQKKIFSSENGKVVFIGNLRGFGPSLIMAHNNHIFSAYLGVDQALAKKNDQVTKGSQIALGRRRVFFSIFIKGSPQDPVKVLSRTVN